MQIGLLGHGVVGSGVQKIIDETFSNNTIEIKKILVKDLNDYEDTRSTTDINDLLNDVDIKVIVECIGGLEPAHTYVLNALKKHKHVVTSNKKMLATYALELFTVAKENNVSIHYEASVGGGIPWIHECNRIQRIDEIQSFYGIMNGTTNYILSSMKEKNCSFEDALKEAQAKGYAEKDPTDDIRGYDVRYKTCLSLLTCFHKYCKPANIPTFGIQSISSDDFSYASSIQCTIKLLGKGTPNSFYVMPVFVPNTYPIASIPLNFNFVSCTSKTLGEASFIGQGAGSFPTAHAMIQDILDIYEGNVLTNNLIEDISNFDYPTCSYYVRTTKKLPDSFIKEKLNETTYITYELNLEKLMKYINEEDFIAEVMK